MFYGSEGGTFFSMAGKVLAGVATQAEVKGFHQILLADELKMQEYIRIRELWQRAARLGDFDQIDAEKDWEGILKKIQAEKTQSLSARASQPQRSRRFRVLPYAAAILLLIALSASLFLFRQQSREMAGQNITVEAPPGSRTKLHLPDGSTVLLNANSSITYSGGFNQVNRDLALSGEAYFEVKASQKPFIVHTNDVSFRVFGTSFNIRAYADEHTIEATLVSGLLRVEGGSDTRGRLRSFMLEPNQKAVFYRETGHVLVDHEGDVADREDMAIVSAPKPEIVRVEIRRQHDLLPDIGWKDGVLVFESEALSDLTRKLERKYDVQFVFLDEALKEHRYTGTIRELTLEQVMQALKLTSPILDYSIREKKVYISSDF